MSIPRWSRAFGARLVMYKRVLSPAFCRRDIFFGESV